jgi:exopolysaccharide biosynthesis polyprenyl glycosylphosphotransferase
MLKERSALGIRLKFLIDTLCVIVSFFVAYYFRSKITSDPFPFIKPVYNYFWLLMIFLPVWWVHLFAFRTYTVNIYKFQEQILFFAKVGLSVLLFLSLIFFLLRAEDANRTLVVPSVLMTAVSMVGWRNLSRRITDVQRKRLLIVGEPAEIGVLFERIADEASRQYDIAGFLADQKPSSSSYGITYRGKYSELFHILQDDVIDEVIFAMPLNRLSDNPELLSVCRMLGINAIAIAELSGNVPTHSGKFFGLPVLIFPSAPINSIAFSIKAVADRVIALIATIVLAPLMALIAVAIKLTSKGPALFIQERAGLNGRTFRMYKFRTMVVDAANLQPALKAYNEMNGPVFKMRKDPRVTSFGYYLRKFSLDELPQLWNVLQGHMSLVGPRPLPVEEANEIRREQRRRLSVKPGITCTWQIRGRNDLDYEQWMNLDLEYIDNWSLWLDLRILLETFTAVVFARGAS